MKKNLKVISSLALAGILATTGLSGVSAVTTTNTITTKSQGIYSQDQLVKGRNIVPYILNNRDDRVTIQDIKDEFGNITKFNGTSVLASNTVVGTGDTFTVNGTTYTVLIYGDINGDGDITSSDALLVQQADAEKVTLDALQKEAANVATHNGVIDSSDALRIRQYDAERVNTVIDASKLPEADKEEVNSDYTMEVVDTTAAHNSITYLNSKNIGSFGVNIHLSKTLSTPNTKTAIKVLDANGNRVKASADSDFSVAANIPAHQDLIYIEVSGLNTKITSNGKVTLQLVEVEGKKETILGKKVVDVNLTTPEVAKVSVTRTNTRNASVSLENIGENSLAKMYYAVVGTGEATPAVFADLKSTIILNANGIENALIASDLVEGEDYKLYYIVEDIYGNQTAISTEDTAAIVPSDKATKAVAVEKDGFTLPNLKDSDEFKWTLKDIAASTDFEVILYKDGKAIAKDTVTASTVAASVKDFTSQMTKAGKYKIGVIVKGDGENTSDSDEVQSGEVDVKALKAVTDIAFTVKEDGSKVLSWKNANKTEEFKDYTLRLYQLNETTGEYGVPTETTPTVTVTEGVSETVLTLVEGKVYKAEVIVNRLDNQKAVVESEAAASEGFFIIGDLTATSTANTDNSMTITLDSEVTVNNKAATYKVEIHKYVKGTDSMGNPTTSTILVRTDNVTVNDKKIVINGLEANTEYSFKVIATVDGIQGESNYTVAAKTLQTTPTIRNLVRVMKQEDAKAGTIYVNGDSVMINGEKAITVDAASNYSVEFKNSIAVVKTLLAGDEITVDGTTVTLKLARINNGTLALADTAKGLTVVIEGNDYERIITTTAPTISSGKVTVETRPEEVVLKGNGALFNVNGLNSKKITLNPGVDVVGTKEYTVSANTQNTAAIINGIKVATAKETVIDATTNEVAGKELVVIVNSAANDLVFENTAGRNVTTQIATIKFKGKDNLSASQSGSIVIKTTGGKVTVAQENANVSSSIKVEVNNGEVDLQNVALTGSQTVTVNNTQAADKVTANTKLTVKAAVAAPIAMTDVEIKDYSASTLEEVQAAVSGVTEENLAEVVKYINSFGIEDGKAKLTTTAGSTTVKIEFYGTVNGTIDGLQK
ncbi:MAG: hypothetical protein HFJ28_00955 [Clostridia bacterium]|nr:hypothetical protein [Clostridia bacterium]